MQTMHISKFLRAILLVDAATCIAMGLLMTLFSARLSALMALPVPLLIYAGLSLFTLLRIFPVRRDAREIRSLPRLGDCARKRALDARQHFDFAGGLGEAEYFRPLFRSLPGRLRSDFGRPRAHRLKAPGSVNSE
jgi:hypothetical protein